MLTLTCPNQSDINSAMSKVKWNRIKFYTQIHILAKSPKLNPKMTIVSMEMMANSNSPKCLAKA